MRFASIATLAASGGTRDSYVIGEDIVFSIRLRCTCPVRSGKLSLRIYSSEGISVYHFMNQDAGFDLVELHGIVDLRLTLPCQKLYPGKYHVALWLADTGDEPFDHIVQAITFQVTPGGPAVFRPLYHGAAVVHEIAKWERLGG